MIAKLGLVEQELDETVLWFELLAESGTIDASRLGDLIDECDLIDEGEQLLRITVASIKTAKARKQQEA